MNYRAIGAISGVKIEVKNQDNYEAYNDDLKSPMPPALSTGSVVPTMVA